MPLFRAQHAGHWLGAALFLLSGSFAAAGASGQQIAPTFQSDALPVSTPANRGYLQSAAPADGSGPARPAGADQPPTWEQYQELVRQLDSQEQRLNRLRQGMPALTAPAGPAPPAIERLPDPEGVAGYYQRLAELEAAARAANAKMPLVRLSGFFDWDTAWFSQDAANIATLGKIQNGTGFRRARLQALGKVTEFTNFSLEMDFATAGHPSFFDVWVEQMNLPVVGNLRLGQFRQPETMDSWTSVRHLEFMERSAPFQAFDPFRRVGIMGWANSEDSRTVWAYSLYGTGSTFWNGTATSYGSTGDSRYATLLSSQGGVSFATRASHLLYYDEPTEGRQLLHVGGGFNFSEIGGNGTTGSDARTFQARSFPEVFVGDADGSYVTAAGTPSVVDTGKFLANNFCFYHAELAGNYGSAHFQGEYMATTVNQLNGPLVFYDGAYLQGGYFLTGESAGYNKLLGVMDYNVKPHSQLFGLGRNAGFGGFGAWELAARWSYVNLSATNVKASNYLASAGPPPSPNPGILNESTVALNWWWNEYTRIEFDWIHGMLNNNLHGHSQLDVAATRVQVEF